MVAPDVRSLVLVLAASAVAAILARLHHRLLLPTVVVEIVLGILIGPEALGFADSDPYIEFLSTMGSCSCSFSPGSRWSKARSPPRARARHRRLGDVTGDRSRRRDDPRKVRRRRRGMDPRRRARDDGARDARPDPVRCRAPQDATRHRGSRQRRGGRVLADRRHLGLPDRCVRLGRRGAPPRRVRRPRGACRVDGASPRPPSVVRVLQETVHTTGQAAVRLSILILAALVLLARDVGFDFVLGAFAAGLVVGLVLDTPDGEVVRSASRASASASSSRSTSSPRDSTSTSTSL